MHRFWPGIDGLSSKVALFDDLRSLRHRVEQHVATGGGPFLGNVFGLVVRQPVDAGHMTIVDGATRAVQQAS